MITVTRVQCLLSEEVRGTPTINPVCAAWLTDNKSNTTGTPLGTSESHHHIHTHVPVVASVILESPYHIYFMLSLMDYTPE